MQVFGRPEANQKDWRYGIAIEGYPQFRGEPVVVGYYETITAVLAAYKETLIKIEPEKRKDVVPIRIPEGKTWEEAQPGEAEVLDNLILQTMIDFQRAGLWDKFGIPEK